MFRSRATRRQATSVSTRRCRLGVELMEGRLMLSASGLDVPNSNVPASQDTLAPALISWTDTRFSTVTQSADGGYIGSMSVTYRISPVGTPMLSSADATGTLLSMGHTDQLSPSDTNSASFVDGFLTFNSTGMQPGGMLAFDSGAVSEISFKPIVLAGPPEHTSGASEGGSIPIHVILADLHKDASFASDLKSNPSKGLERPTEPTVSMRPADMSDSAMSGEWARAVVFEIAGGEPGSSTPTADGETTVQHDEPVTSIELPQRKSIVADRDGATTAASGERQRIESVHLQASETKGPAVAAIVPSDLSDAKGKMLEGALFAGNPFRVGRDFDDAGLATAAVFDRLADENATIIESTVDRRSWTRSVGTTPLLMILALERIAALNSRRATRESRNAAAKKSLRLPS